MSEFRRYGTLWMIFVYVPIALFQYMQSSGLSEQVDGRGLTMLLAMFALFVAFPMFFAWALPLFVRRARSAGIHWLIGVPVALLFTPLVFIVLCFLPGPDHDGMA